MKKLFLCLMMGTYYPMMSVAQMDGSGTANDPYQVRTAFDLFDVRAYPNAYYKQMNDIDLADWIAEESPTQGWAPIPSFSGTYDGNNKSIKGLYINKPSANYIGLFGIVTGLVKNVCLINPIIVGADYVGTIAGNASTYNMALVDNVCIGGCVTGNNYVGGIVGQHTANRTSSFDYYIKGNYSSSSIKGNSCCGGIMGGVIGCKGYNNGYDINVIPHVCDNHYCGSMNASSLVGGIVGEGYSGGNISYWTAALRLLLDRNIVGGVIKGGDKTNGIWGGIEGYENTYSVSNQVCYADTISGILPYRIFSEAFPNNYAYNATTLIRGGVAINAEDNDFNGISYGANTLKRKNTYVGMGFDFDTQWAISEGSSFPYNINQSAPPVITFCTSGDHAKISGTASSDGTIYVFEGNSMYEETIVDGKWEVQLGELAEGAIVKVSADTEKLMPSILVSTKAESLAIVFDENSASILEAATGVDVRVKRTIRADEWSTICLPFAMTEAQVKAAFGSDVQLADFMGYEVEEDEDGNVAGLSVNFSDADAIEANHPYLIKVSAAVSEFTADGVDIDPEDEPTVAAVKRTRKQWSEFIGTYAANTAVPEKTLFLSGNKFYYSTGATKMKAFRGYFDFYDVLTEVDESYAKVRFFIDDTAAEIEGIGGVMQTGAVYSVSGVRMGTADRLKTLPKGLYIVNGKKVYNQ